MSFRLPSLPEQLGSPRFLYAVGAVVVSYALLSQPLLPVSQPKPISSAPSLRNIGDSSVVNDLKKLYPEDLYPSSSYFRGPHGETHYYVLGNSGPKYAQIVLVHGLSIPGLVWKLIAPRLVERGFQVLVYDLYGRAYSDAPDVPYSTSLYTTQLALLLQYLRWDKARIVGLSMGGAISIAFGSEHPHLVDGRIVVIAPAGMVQLKGVSIGRWLLASTIVRAVLTSPPLKQLFGGIVTPRRIAGAESKPLDAVERVVALQTEALPGYARALTSSFRDGPPTGLDWAFARVGQNPALQVLHIHGTSDNVVPYAATVKSIASHIPAANLQQVSLENAGHDLCYDPAFAPRIVEEISRFLST